MLSMASVSAGQDAYYSGLAREDYYLDGGEPPGVWQGRGAEKLGLHGEVDPADFSQMFEGKLRGMPLTQNAGKPTRSPGWDLTFSAPKSVSVAWSQANRSEAQEIRAAHLEAVTKALAYLEENAGWTRRGKDGLMFEKALLSFATFEHGTNRNQEPQLHSHCVTLNVSSRADGSTGTVFARALFQHKMAAGAIYRAELAYQLERRLGLVAEMDGRSFKLIGVSEEVVAAFSTRAKEMRELAKELGYENPTPERLAQLAVTSRMNKSHEPRVELEQIWRSKAQELGWSTKELEALISAQGLSERPDRDIRAQIALSNAIDSLTENQSTFTKKDLVRATAEQAQVYAIGADQVQETVKAQLVLDPNLVSLGLDDGEIRFTTQEILDLEGEMLERVEQSKTEGAILASPRSVEEALQNRPTINEGQLEMVRYLTHGNGRIKTIIGDAGTGKTFAMEAVKEAVQASGYKIRGAALAGAAAEQLAETGIPSQTIESLLWWLNNRPETAAGPILDNRTMLVVDEAGMVDTRRLAELIRHTERAGATLVLIGDPKQLQAVNQGGGFAKVHADVEGRRLTENMRQKHDGDKMAVKAVSEGKAMDFLNHVASEGRLHIKEHRINARVALVQNWMENESTNPKQSLIFAGTNSDVSSINQEIQARRLEAGQISSLSATIHDTKGQAVGSLHQGDRLIFIRKNKGLGLENGNFATVESVSNKTNLVRVTLDKDGSARTLSLHEFTSREIAMGYAVTTHKGQGMTVENGYMLTDEFMTDLEMSYVQASRAKLNTHVYTTELEAGEELATLAKTMSRSREKELATVQAKRFEPISESSTQTQTQTFDLKY